LGVEVIKRYRCYYLNDFRNDYDAFREESADGEYVLFTDAESDKAEALAAKYAEIALLQHEQLQLDGIHRAEIEQYRTERLSLVEQVRERIAKHCSNRRTFSNGIQCAQAIRSLDLSDLTKPFVSNTAVHLGEPDAGLKGGWQPIEEAPKDGTEVWAYNGDQQRMHYLNGDDWQGWLYGEELLNDADPLPEQPTYFRPLPSPPIAQERQQ
jgi:hypothetical protein